MIFWFWDGNPQCVAACLFSLESGSGGILVVTCGVTTWVVNTLYLLYCEWNLGLDVSREKAFVVSLASPSMVFCYLPDCTS